MKKILIAVSAFALFAAFSGVARAGDEGKAPAPATKTTKKPAKAADGTAPADTKTDTTKKEAAPAKK